MVARVSTVPLDVLKEEVAASLLQKYPDLTVVNLAQNVSADGINFRSGMVIVHGFVGGLPDFAEIVQMCVLKDGLTFIVKKISSWYREHYRSFELGPSPRDVSVIELSQLVDRYPLCDYKVGTLRMVTLKRYIHSSGNIEGILGCFGQNAVFLFNPNLHKMFRYHFLLCTSTGSFDTG